MGGMILIFFGRNTPRPNTAKNITLCTNSLFFSFFAQIIRLLFFPYGKFWGAGWSYRPSLGPKSGGYISPIPLGFMPLFINKIMTFLSFMSCCYKPTLFMHTEIMLQEHRCSFTNKCIPIHATSLLCFNT